MWKILSIFPVDSTKIMSWKTFLKKMKPMEAQRWTNNTIVSKMRETEVEVIASGRWNNMKRSLAAYKKSDLVQMNNLIATIQQDHSLEDLLFGHREIEEMQKNLEALKKDRMDILGCQNIPQEDMGAFYEDIRQHERKLW